MKVGILTLPLWNNYGGIIQAYALKEVLSSQGNIVTLIDYHHASPSTKDRLKGKLIKLAKKTLGLEKSIQYYPSPDENLIISRETFKFIENEFEIKTKKICSTEELKSSTENLNAIIVGSDQVWRPNYTPNIFNYFLGFTNNNQIKLSYAASFGTDSWLFTEDEQEKCKSLLKSFTAISVREDSGISLVKDKFENDSIQLVDPTMLLTKEVYGELIDKYRSKEQGKGIFCYVLDRSAINEIIISKVSDLVNLSSFEIMPRKFDKNFKSTDPSYVFPPLTDWLRCFRDADFVIADSFHGCVFSIIFNKPFLAIGNEKRGLARFHSLLSKFGLQSRLIFSKEDITDEKIKYSFDWLKINKVLDTERELAENFLKDNLSNEG